MSQTTVIEEVNEGEAKIIADYEKILSGFTTGEAPTHEEQVMIEKKIVGMFERAMGGGDEAMDAEHREKMENVVDAATAVCGILSTVWAVNGAVSGGGFDVAHAIHAAATNLVAHSSVAFGAAGALAPVLMLLVSIWNLHRALNVGKRVKEANDTFVRWDKYYMHELDKAQARAEQAVDELAKYFVSREALLRMRDPSRTSAIQYEMGKQMARCMSAVEYRISKYQDLIDKAEQTLAAIEQNAVELEATAKRNRTRGWVAVVVGGIIAVAGIAMILTSGGTLIPIATAIAGAATAGTGGYVVHLSHQQLASLKQLCENIKLAHHQLDRHRAACDALKEQVMLEIKKAKKYVTEAEKDVELAALRRQLAEAAAQNTAFDRRASRLQGGEKDQRNAQVMAILDEYRLAKYYDLVVGLGVECADDIADIDEDVLRDVDCSPIVKKKLLKMVREVTQQ